ncbi:hypothetical protein ACWEJ6_21540 [Nonomuraea sp. NPDC004702]
MPQVVRRPTVPVRAGLIFSWPHSAGAGVDGRLRAGCGGGEGVGRPRTQPRRCVPTATSRRERARRAGDRRVRAVAGLAPTVPAWVPAGAFAATPAVGAVAGICSAIRASHLPPAVALASS